MIAVSENKHKDTRAVANEGIHVVGKTMLIGWW